MVAVLSVQTHAAMDVAAHAVTHQVPPAVPTAAITVQEAASNRQPRQDVPHVATVAVRHVPKAAMIHAEPDVRYHVRENALLHVGVDATIPVWEHAI